jgi:uncharacterized protein with GYD domain
MAKFLMLGKYSPPSVNDISPERTKHGAAIIKNLGGKVEASYALLGGYDLALIADFPGNAEVIKASVALTKLSGIGFTSFPAVTIEELSKDRTES